MKLAQNNLLKEKNAKTVIEGELAHFRSLLAKIQQQPYQKLTQQDDQQVTISNVQLKVKERKSDLAVVSDEPKHFAASIDQQTSMTSDNEKNSNTVNIPNQTISTDATIVMETDTSKHTNSLSRKLNSKVTREAKIKPGQKIDNVVKKLSQECVPHILNTTSSAKEVTFYTDDKSTRRSLDAVVAQLHIVKKQQFDKQFHVDLGLAKQVRENSKLDSVVEKLVAKQSQFEALLNKNTTGISSIADSSLPCMEPDVSSTVPDDLDDTESKSMVTEASIKAKDKFRSTLAKDTNEPVTLTAIPKTRQLYISIVDPVTMQADITKVQTKLVSGPNTVNKMETIQTPTDNEADDVSKSRSKEKTDQKEEIANSTCFSTNLPTRVPVTSSTIAPVTPVHSNVMLAAVRKYIIEKFSVKQMDLEGLLGQDDSNVILNDTTYENLTEFYAEISQGHTQQDTSVPDEMFVELLQVVFISFLVNPHTMIYIYMCDWA